MTGSDATVFELDARCTYSGCPTRPDGEYVMVGGCRNCRHDNIRITLSRGHEAHPQDCPVCGCWRAVTVRHLAPSLQESET